MTNGPLISVVIPTYGRPLLVERAARSALSQTLQRIEVIVVIDGPDKATRAALSFLSDPRLRVIEPPARVGANAARNLGVVEAHGEWIALLDDDDEWMPSKLQVQLDVALGSGCPEPMLTCRVLRRSPHGEYVLGRRLPRPGEHVSDYMFVRHGLAHGEGFIQTSTIVARRRLFLRVPFRESLRAWQDTEWILHAFAVQGVTLEMAAEVLSVLSDDEKRPRVSATVSWAETLAWARENRAFFTRRAYASFLMSVVADIASKAHDPRSLAALWREAVRHGRPTLLDHLTFVRICIVPRRLRRAMAAFVLRRLVPPGGHV